MMEMSDRTSEQISIALSAMTLVGIVTGFDIAGGLPAAKRALVELLARAHS